MKQQTKLNGKLDGRRRKGAERLNLLRGIVLLCTFVAAGVLGGNGRAFGDGILIPEPPDAPNFAIKYHHVSVSIEGQVATTEIDQVFENRSNRELEATYVFPLPSGAAIREFDIYEGGQRVVGRLLDREKARRIYEDIVSRRKDPGLLEYIGRDMYQARVFPIPAGGEKRLQMKYTELLKQDGNVITYSYPLSTEKFSSEPIEEVKLSLEVESPQASILSVYSPTHDVEVKRSGNHRALVEYVEHGTRPAGDFILHYTTSSESIAPSVLTHRVSGEDGFFIMMASPAAETESEEGQAKDVAFVMDTSGSMSGEKIEQAKAALIFCLNSLKRDDRFQIVSFSDSLRPFRSGRELLPATRQNIDEARDFAEALQANGGTDIHSALESALSLDFSSERPGYLVFLTDGLPTVGLTDVEEILKRAKDANYERSNRLARIFAFGVGYDVNTHFLDKLTADNGGVSEYVRPSEDIEVKVSKFFSKVAKPILTDVQLDFEGVEVYDLYPKEMPDLFAGSQLIVLGRYKTTELAEAKVDLSGLASPDRKHFTTSATFPRSEPENSYVEPLWAARKVGYLLDEIRLHGENEELIDEVVRLSTQYGILTEYTAFLADEGARLTSREALEEARTVMAPGMAKTSGSWAVSQAQNSRSLADQAQVGANYVQYDAAGNRVAYSTVRLANNQAQFNRAGNWEDSRYREGQSVINVRAFSEAQFQLGRRFPSLNQAFSAGDRVLVFVNNQAVQIGTEGKEQFTEEELEQLGPAESEDVTEALNPVNPAGHGLPLGLVIASLAIVAAAGTGGLRLRSKIKG